MIMMFSADVRAMFSHGERARFAGTLSRNPGKFVAKFPISIPESGRKIFLWIERLPRAFPKTWSNRAACVTYFILITQ